MSSTGNDRRQDFWRAAFIFPSQFCERILTQEDKAIYVRIFVNKYIDFELQSWRTFHLRVLKYICFA